MALRDGAGLVGTGRQSQPARDGQVRGEAVERTPRPHRADTGRRGGRPERFAWLVEKAAELGVTRVVPLETERTAGVASRSRRGADRQAAPAALETLKQCGAAWACGVADR